MKLMNGFDSNYRYVLVAARRARQLSGGAPPLVDTNARKVCRIAQEEIAAGKIQFTITASKAKLETGPEPEKSET
ncbi:MAG TPA: DNA-directed RNA polymerase subunit omega [Candidatus Angelobacter sp.]|nr:DNA-directed RNA polymerase subunit omega [Candidatus Angelobacter sp.]